MELKTLFAQDASGNVIAAPAVHLYQLDGITLAAGLQDAGGADLSNPFSGEDTGRIQLAAPDGDYMLRIVGAGRDYRQRVRFIDVTENKAAAQAAQHGAEQAAAASAVSAEQAVNAAQSVTDAAADVAAAATVALSQVETAGGAQVELAGLQATRAEAAASAAADTLAGAVTLAGLSPQVIALMLDPAVMLPVKAAQVKIVAGDATAQIATRLTAPLTVEHHAGSPDIAFAADGSSIRATVAAGLAIGTSLTAVARVLASDGSGMLLAITVSITDPPITISGAPPAAVAGAAYAFKPATSDGSGTKVFTLSGDLPAGLAFSPATGAITGTPVAAGVAEGLVITVTDDTGSASLGPFDLAVTWLAEAHSYFAALAIQPSVARKARYNRFIRSLKVAGVWAKLAGIRLLGHDLDAIATDLKNPALKGTYVNGVTFVPDQRLQWDGVASYMDTGYNPVAAGSGWQQNACAMGVRVAAEELPLGASSGDCGQIRANIAAYTSQTVQVALTPQSGGGTYPARDQAPPGGFILWSRDNAASAAWWQNGMRKPDIASASAAALNSTFLWGGYRADRLSSRAQEAFVWCNTSLSDADAAALTTALDQYFGNLASDY